MAYKVVITVDAQEDFDRHLRYLIEELVNYQAAGNLLDDLEATKNSLSRVAGSLKLCDNPKLQEKGYRRINYLHHDYFMLYRIEGELAIVDNIFHFLEDYENKMQ